MPTPFIHGISTIPKVVIDGDVLQSLYATTAAIVPGDLTLGELLWRSGLCGESTSDFSLALEVNESQIPSSTFPFNQKSGHKLLGFGPRQTLAHH